MNQKARKPLAQIPDHLLPYITIQDPSLYTPMDHASWRYILRVSRDFFSNNAHQKYLDGLKETGINLERIPLIDEMDTCLKRFGWRAVAVNGFIPPAVFMEFQSLGILPIACEMRTLEHLAYTPAPDIVHEAAGHAPIIADPEYSAYLRAYGEVARKAIFSSQDMALYEAIRNLSEVKEDPVSTETKIKAAQKLLDDTIASIHYTSEATFLARMNWWTVEYGLVGNIRDPKIYGAGLLSSVGESFACLGEKVRKIPFTLDCVNTAYDITKPQPQLFVTDDFNDLTRVLEEISKTMAYRIGGTQGLAKAKMASTLVTIELETGIQASGILESFEVTNIGNGSKASYSETGSPANPVSFFKLTGPCQLSMKEIELPGHSLKTHNQGFSSPIGNVLPFNKPACNLTERELQTLGFVPARKGKLIFESGFTVEGEWVGTVKNSSGQNVILSFQNCTVKNSTGEIYFEPNWGNYDMICGSKVVSVFGGAADRVAYAACLEAPPVKKVAGKTNLTEANRALNDLYRNVRDLRESLSEKQSTIGPDFSNKIISIHSQLTHYPKDWLLRLELLELTTATDLLNKGPELKPFKILLENELKQLENESDAICAMIQRGKALLC